MAKISAYGDEAATRWVHADGRRLVLTRKGRLLGNWLKGDPLKVLIQSCTSQAASEFARERGFVRK